MKKLLAKLIFAIVQRIAGICVKHIKVESAGLEMIQYYAGLTKLSDILSEYDKLVLQLNCYQYEYEIKFLMTKGVFNGATFILKRKVDLHDEPKTNPINKLK